MKRQPQSFGDILLRALILPLAAFFALATYAVGVEVLQPVDLETSVTNLDRQEQMDDLVDPADFPGCVEAKQFPSTEIPRSLVVVDDLSWSVDRVPFDQGFNDSAAGKVWIVLACS